ncbi:MAG TPA: histidine phosphatase family protein [Actinomycetota bacterium]|nr:histidine phosphatase family protein [Actinomycetota bacterium]
MTAPHTRERTTGVHLIRHGRTGLNAEGRFRGRRDVPLDDMGRREAARAAPTLADLGLVAVYTSPLRRAVATAEAIARVAGADVIVQGGLIDLDYGD